MVKFIFFLVTIFSINSFSQQYCRTQCKNDIQMVQESITVSPGTFRCVYKANIPCAPYACANAYECKTACVSSKDCTDGYGCSQNGKCTPKSYDCADGMTARAYDGTMTNCSPYQCLHGQCRTSCNSQAECFGSSKCVNQQCK